MTEKALSLYKDKISEDMTFRDDAFCEGLMDGEKIVRQHTGQEAFFAVPANEGEIKSLVQEFNELAKSERANNDEEYRRGLQRAYMVAVQICASEFKKAQENSKKKKAEKDIEK